jgi:hypothetical protein
MHHQFALIIIMYVFVPSFAFDSQLLRPAVEWTLLSFRTRAGPGSDLGFETGIRAEYSWLSASQPVRCRSTVLNELYINRPFVRRNRIVAIDITNHDDS